MHKQFWTLLLLSLGLLAAFGARAAPQPVRLAVLEFEVSADLKIDRTYFSDLARGAVHNAAPRIFVMTRESTEALLNATGRTMNDCTGECEIEVGRKLGADYIVSGRITQVGSRLSLTMRLFSTADGELIQSVEARGKTADELLDHSDSALDSLVAPLKNREAERAAALAKPELAKIAPAPAPEQKAVGVETKPAPAPPIAPLPAPVIEAKPVVQAPPLAPAPVELKPVQIQTGSRESSLTNSYPAAPADSVSVAGPAPTASHVKLGWAALGAGAVLAGGAVAFDNLSSTSKDNKLTAADFIPIAGYAIAAALGGFGVYEVVRQ